MDTGRAARKRLNPFVFPSETNARFVLLIVAALALAWALGESIQAELIVSNLFPNPSYEALPHVEADNTGLAVQIAAYGQMLRQEAISSLIPALTIFAVLALATAIYRSHPAYIRRTKKLRQVAADQEPALTESIHGLSSRAGISPPPSIEVEVGSRSADGQAFGLRPHYALRLGGRMGLLLRKAPDVFRAIVLHELGHMANQDVGRTYFAQALWTSTIYLVLGPFLVVTQSLFLFSSLRSLLSKGLAGFDWARFTAVTLPVNLLTLLQAGMCLLVVAAVRASVLRVREIYADWRAAQWGAEQPLSAILAQERSAHKKGPWQRLLQLHPPPQQRLAMLRDPTALFRTRLDLPVLAGILLAFLLSGLGSLAGTLFLLSSAITTIPVTAAMRALDRSNVLQGRLFFLLGTLGQIGGWVVSILLGLALFMLAAYLTVGTVGSQIQRESLVDILAGRRGWTAYARLLLPAILITVGLQAGFLCFPYSSLFAPVMLYIADQVALGTIFGHALWMLLWIAATTVLTWLWLVYLRFFSIRLLGRHGGALAPSSTRRVLMLASSILLFLLYLPAIAGQLFISGLIMGQPETFLPLLPFALAASLLLCPPLIAATWLRVRAHCRRNPPRCAACGQVAAQPIVIGQTCAHCGHDLAPWLYAG